MGYFDKVKGMTGKVVNVADKFTGGINEVSLSARKAIEGKNDALEQGEREFPFLGYVFYPAGGLGVKTTFFEDYMEHGGDNIAYSDIRTINITHIASNNLTNGTAQATTMAGKILTLAVKTTDMTLFIQAIGYANNRINEINDGKNVYKGGIQANDGTFVEVYDDYLIFKRIGEGIVAKTSKDALSFAEIDFVSIESNAENVSVILQTKENKQQIVLSVPDYCANKAREIVEFIEQRKSCLDKETEEESRTPIDAWKSFEGRKREFTLNGELLSISAEMDLFNSYRLKFRDVANEYAFLAEKEYRRKVSDLDTFLMFFKEIYMLYLDKLIQGCVDILIAEGIWTETVDSIKENHLQNFHMALDEYHVMQESLAMTDQNNHQMVDDVSGVVPTLRGGGYGFKGAMKGIAKAEAFNFVKGAAVNMMQNAIQVTPAQKAELFGRIDEEQLFEKVFFDYWNVYFAMIEALVSNGKQIWIPNNVAISQAENISKNLSNPNFPQDRATQVIIQILSTCPYKKEFQQLLRSKFGNTDQVNAINNYFGYSDFEDVHITG